MPRPPRKPRLGDDAKSEVVRKAKEVLRNIRDRTADDECDEVMTRLQNALKDTPSGNKYRREIPTGEDGLSDIYDVLVAFRVTCPARAHAVKKLLMSGQRGKGDVSQDLREARYAVTRSIELVGDDE